MLALKSAVLVASLTLAPLAASALPTLPAPEVQPGFMRVQAPKKTCRREPIWGFRMSPFCKPTGICSDRVIKGYRTVCD